MTERRITRGPWKWDTFGGESVLVGAEIPGTSVRQVVNFSHEGNQAIIALAGTTANDLYDLGYDAERVLEDLVEIIQGLPHDKRTKYLPPLTRGEG